VVTILSGMTRTCDIEENLRTFSPLKPCGEREFEALERAAQALLGLNTIACNQCNYCMPCPYGLDIPALLTFRNECLVSKNKLSDREIYRLYQKRISEPLRRAEHCTGCGRCNPHCPQMLDIPKEIGKIAAWIDEIKNRLVQ
jgi:predicted aldo/keto reductase-like oxidoreductase